MFRRVACLNMTIDVRSGPMGDADSENVAQAVRKWLGSSISHLDLVVLHMYLEVLMLGSNFLI